MATDTILLSARWIVPVEPSNITLEYHTLVISTGRIIDILSTEKARLQYPVADEEYFPGHVLIPGFINAHTHAAMTLLRGIGNDKPLMEWLNRYIWPLEKAWVNEAFVADGSDLAMAEMIRGGITCFNDMYFFPNITAQQAALCGMRAVVGMILVDFPTTWASDPEDYLAKGVALRDTWEKHPLITTMFGPHAPYSVSDQSLRKMQKYVLERNQPVQMHLHETLEELQNSYQHYGVKPLARLDRLGLLGPHFLAVHMTQMDTKDIDLVASKGVHVIHCPESNLKLASGFCPVAQLVEAGVNVAIGTDGAASNNDLDMMSDMRTSALLAKAVAGDASAIPAHIALRMATLNGAKALGLAQEIGSLEVGKAADVTAIHLDTLETQPIFDPLSNLVYSASRRQVSDVWVAGKRLLKNYTLTTLDTEAICQKAIRWRERLMTSLS